MVGLVGMVRTAGLVGMVGVVGMVGMVGVVGMVGNGYSYALTRSIGPPRLVQSDRPDSDNQAALTRSTGPPRLVQLRT